MISIQLCLVSHYTRTQDTVYHLFMQQYIYTSMSLGYCANPLAFPRVLARDPSMINVKRTILAYVDNLLICSPTKEQCEADSVAVLTKLAIKGHKVRQITIL